MSLQKRKQAFLSIVNQIKGFVRGVVGNPPLTLSNCVDDKSLIDYRIYGDSVQNLLDAMPAPDNPITIQSVGEKTSNILDVANAPFVFSTRTASADSIRALFERTPTGFKGNFYKDFGSVSFQIGYILGRTEDFKGKTITVSFDEAILNSGSKPYIAVYATSKQGISIDKMDENASWNDVINGYIGGSTNIRIGVNDTNYQTRYLIAQIPEDVDSETYPYLYTSFYLGYGAGSNPIGSTFEYKGIKVKVGNNVTEYEPFGYKIPVITKGKNLVIGATAFNAEINGSKTVASLKFPTLEKGKTYTLSFKTDASYIGARIQMAQSALTSAISGFSQSNPKFYVITNGERQSITFTMAEDFYRSYAVAVLQLSAQSTVDSGILSDFMIEEGDNMTDYQGYIEPTITNVYVREPLRRMFDSNKEYCDYIDYKNGKVIRNLCGVFLDGVGHLANGIQSTNSYGIANFYVNQTNNGNALPLRLKSNVGICNRFEIQNSLISNTSTEGFMISTSNDAGIIYVRINSERASTLAEFNEWLKTHNIEIVYVIAEPTEEDISLPILPTFKGTTIYEIDTAIQPSKMEAEYYSTSKE